MELQVLQRVIAHIEEHCTRAFKKEHGVLPSAYKKAGCRKTSGSSKRAGKTGCLLWSPLPERYPPIGMRRFSTT